VTEQVELLELAALSEQVVEPKLPEAAGLALKVTVPAGADLLPASVSPTVAVQTEPWLRATEAGLQETLVAVVRLLTVMSKLPLLMACRLLPP
jgi:hypothetical protein